MKGVVLTGETVPRTIMKEDNFAKAWYFAQYRKQAIISGKRKFEISRCFANSSVKAQYFNCILVSYR